MMKTRFLTGNYPTHPNRGQSLVEFALAATLMIFMLVATIDFGLAFLSWITLRDAAQEGAAYSSIFPPTSLLDSDPVVTNIKYRVKYAASTPVDLSTLANDHIVISIHNTPGNATGACPGNSVQVTVTYDYPVITPIITNFIGSPTIPVSATVVNTILRKGNGMACVIP